MARIERHSARVAAAWPLLVAELLGRGDAVVLLAKVARVLVVVASAHRKRDGVVYDRRLGDAALGEAHFAKAVGALQSAQALLLPRPAAKPLDSHSFTPGGRRRRLAR